MFTEDKTTLQIPNQFTLFGHRYTVVFDKDLYEKEGCYGTADDDFKLIRLQPPGEVLKRYEDDGVMKEEKFVITDNVVIETFFHEVNHIILDAIGENQLSENEKFVNMLGKAWLEIYLSNRHEKVSKEKETRN